MTKLLECISQQIRQDGPIPFQQFMELCLYDEKFGYYTTKCEAIGKDGDFYTSATLTPVFGALLGKQIEEMWEQTGNSQFTVVEYGAGTGNLCKDILDYLEANSKIHAGLRYCIIEKSPLMRNLAKKQLSDRVEWYNSISEIPEISGCILSNELVDNFAIHRVVMQKELMEIYVDYQNGFTELLRPARPELKAYLCELGIDLPEGYATEINLEAVDWIGGIASSLKSGYVITIDYGYKNEEMYKTSRSEGTLVCYHKHSVNDSFYEYIGEQDMTSHVNFSALIHWGAKGGLKETGFTNQGYFLTALGFREQLLKELSSEQNVILAAQRAASLTHTLIFDMGSKFKVLIQQKGVEDNKLTGLVQT